MVTIFTEDGRTLQYQDSDRLTIVGFTDRYPHDLRCLERRARDLQSGDYVWVQGKGRNFERDPDLARVKEIAR